ncbi:SIR2 family protein [Vreelandella titanicae]|uniref:SIR2 family protein n=1 Tax=Vreelandella titanicae TaxID=664683 RepID=UPI003CFBD55B
MEAHNNNCDCVNCKNKIDVQLPEELVDEILSAKVTFFTGAGISTESPMVLNINFYQEVAREIDALDKNLSFPKLMQEFCKQANGRMKLLQMIRSRFRTIDSFPELQKRATSFHKAIGTLFSIKNVVTTNWDTYFEDFAHATPFVIDSDLAFWEVAERRVLKIHGSIDNLSTLVATEDDYSECTKRLNEKLIGGMLKTILATQTVIFVGYSMRDSDFQEIYGLVKTQMDLLHRQAYVVTPFEDEAKRFESAGLIPIVTDGTYFLELVKKEAVIRDLLLPDISYVLSSFMLNEFEDEHFEINEKVSNTECPEIIFATCYQDGVIHALQRISKNQYSGEYSHPCRMAFLIEKYEEIKSEKRKAKNYIDVAYIEGYIRGLVYHLSNFFEDDEFEIPKYFAFGAKEELYDFEDFTEFVKCNPQAHKASLKQANQYLNSLHDPDKIVVHHPPWI